MEPEDIVVDEDKGLPKKKLASGFIGLALVLARFLIESALRSMIDAIVTLFAVGTLLVLAIGLFGFISAYEYKTEQDKQEKRMLRRKIDSVQRENLERCDKCSFSYQSALVGISNKNMNDLQDQRDFYEDYIAAVLYTFNQVLVRLAKSEASMMPLIEALLDSPMYKIEETEDLVQWKNFLTQLADQNNRRRKSSSKVEGSTQQEQKNS